MLFAERERVLYRVNPLAEVICQLRFPTILRIREGQLAEFQDTIRSDYPIYTDQEPSIQIPMQLTKELADIIGRINFPVPMGLVTRRFSTKDSSRFISLSDEFVAIANTKYERWELFREEIVKAERALKGVYQPAFYSRVGLRYRDVISRDRLELSSVGWHELLQPYIVAELGDHSLLGAIGRIQTRAVIVISEIPDGQITLTHGLTKSAGSDEECYMIDADFAVERKEGVSEPFEILDKFHKLAGRLFRWAITEKLHNAMGPRPI